MTAKAAATEGATFEETVCTNLTRSQIVMYAGASGDFNPLHTDEVYATEVAGQPTVIAHGMLLMAMMGDVLASRFGVERLVRFGAQFRGVVRPGDDLTVRGHVTAVGHDKTGIRTAQLDLRMVTADETDVLVGSATVRV